MTRKAHVRVVGRIDNVQGATVTIDAHAGLISVRPFRRRRQYTLPLADVARRIVYEVASAELAQKRRSKKAKRGFL